VDVTDTRLPVIVVSMLAIAVSVGDAIPDNSERRPTDDERRTEQCHVVPPAHVDEGREYIGKVATTTFSHVLAGDVAGAVLVNDPSRLTRREASSTVDQSLKDTFIKSRLVASIIRHLWGSKISLYFRTNVVIFSIFSMFLKFYLCITSTAANHVGLPYMEPFQ